MAVAFDAVGPSSAGAKAAAATSLTWSHTVGAGANALVVGCAAGVPGGDAGKSITATYAGVTMTPGVIVHSGGGSTGFLRVFTLLDPTPGANNVVCTLTGGGFADLTGGSISLLGAGSFVAQYSAASSGIGTNATATSVGSTSGGMIAGFCAAGADISSATAPSTSRYIANLNVGSSASNSAGATSPSTGSNVTTAWTVSVADNWVVIGVEVLASPAAGPPLTPALLIQQGLWRPWMGTDSAATPDAPAEAPEVPYVISQYGGFY